MKKKFIFINDIRTFVFFVIVAFFFAVLLVFSLMGTDGFTNTIICIAIFGGFLMLAIAGLLLTFELIFFYQDKIVSLKLFRRIEIFYTEISNINTTRKDIGADAMEDVWEIQMCNKKTIYLIRTKKRDKIIEKINNLR